MRELERRWLGPELLSFSLKGSKAKVRRITRLLENEYGIPPKRKLGDPLDVLIETVLSQHTNDRNRDQAYRRLKIQFPHWEEVLEAEVGTLIETIRPAGLAAQKARRIYEILRWIKEHYGGLSLVLLKKMDSERIKKTIGSLKGVGPKTVHCLLLFGLGREAFPVDTHVLRIGKRLGFFPEKINAERAHTCMALLVPKGKSLSLHLNLIRLGRSICKANNPQCRSCFLTDECLISSRQQEPLPGLTRRGGMRCRVAGMLPHVGLHRNMA